MQIIKTLTALLAAVIFSSHAYGQVITGSVIDDQGGVVAYATVYAPAAKTGVLTDDKGTFQIDLKEIPDSSSVHFSCIGYTGKKLTAGDIRRTAEPMEVTLPTINYLLQTAEVSAERIKYKRKKLGMSGLMNGTYGYATKKNRSIIEIGTLLTPDGEARLEEIIIKVRDMEADSLLMDINIYDVRFGLVGESLLKERIFLELGKDDVRKDISVDLSERNLFVERTFLVTFRVLDVVGAFGQVKLSAKTGSDKGFARNASGPWVSNYMTPNIRAVVGYKKE